MSDSKAADTAPPVPGEVIDAETGEVISVEDSSPGTALAPPAQRGIVLSTVADLDVFSARLAKSQLVPRQFRDKPADVFLALNMGLELGLSPIASLRSLHVIEGRPSLSADAMVGVIMSSGACEYFICVESSPEIAIYATRRRGAPSESRASFTIEEAQKANLLGKDNWQRHPRAMLKARAKSMLARDVYPDVLHGIYTPEEIESFEASRTVLDELKDLLLEAKTKADTDAIGQRAMLELTSQEQDQFRPLMRKHIATLRAHYAKQEGKGRKS